jgi:hypothetical protein
LGSLNIVDALADGTKKKTGERWFMLALDAIWQEHETPQDVSYVLKDALIMK